MITTMVPVDLHSLGCKWIPHTHFKLTTLWRNAIIWNDTTYNISRGGSSGGMSGCNHCILTTARSKEKGGQIPLIPFLEQASIECNLLCLLQSNTSLVFGLFRSDFDCLQLSSLQPCYLLVCLLESCSSIRLSNHESISFLLFPIIFYTIIFPNTFSTKASFLRKIIAYA